MTNPSSIISVKDYVRAELSDAAASAGRKFRECALPLYRHAQGVLEHVGTAFVIEHAGGLYLLTAAHVLDHAGLGTLYIGSQDVLVALEGVFRATVAPLGTRAKDHFDFAWLRLEGDMAERLGKVRHIPECDISLNRVDPTGRVYWAVGYPNSKNRPRQGLKSVRPRRFTYYSTSVFKQTLMQRLHLDGSTHLMIGYGKKSRDEEGAEVDSIELRGISGGPLFDLGGVILKGKGQKPLLSGLVIEHYRNDQAIVAVRIDLVRSTMTADSGVALVADVKEGDERRMDRAKFFA